MPMVPEMSEQESARFWAKIEKTRTCWNWTAAKHRGYGQFKVSGTTRKSHRISYELAHGAIPDGMMIDHRCHNRSCVNPDHLRVATPRQNMENLGASWSISGLRGVTFDPRRGKWRAYARSDGKQHHGGYFSNLDDAKRAAKALRNRMYTYNDLDRIPE